MYEYDEIYFLFSYIIYKTIWIVRYAYEVTYLIYKLS